MGGMSVNNNLSVNTNSGQVVVREGVPQHHPGDPALAKSEHQHQTSLVDPAAPQAQTSSVSQVMTVVDIEPEGQPEGELEIVYGEQVNIGQRGRPLLLYSTIP